MRKLFVSFLFVIAALATLGVQGDTAVPVTVPDLDLETALQAGGSCGCPKTAPVCCRNCDGSFAYCARSFAFCPECPAP
jgi:hypothetical protein